MSLVSEHWKRPHVKVSFRTKNELLQLAALVGVRLEHCGYFCVCTSLATDLCARDEADGGKTSVELMSERLLLGLKRHCIRRCR